MTDDLSGFWGGLFGYGDGPPTEPFDAEFLQDGHRLLGHITEPNSFVEDGPVVLAAHVEGAVEGSAVSFIKTYDGKGAAHSVHYDGRITERGTVIAGVWRIDSYWGPFEMHRDPGAAETVRAETVSQRRSSAPRR